MASSHSELSTSGARHADTHVQYRFTREPPLRLSRATLLLWQLHLPKRPSSIHEVGPIKSIVEPTMDHCVILIQEERLNTTRRLNAASPGNYRYAVLERRAECPPLRRRRPFSPTGLEHQERRGAQDIHHARGDRAGTDAPPRPASADDTLPHQSPLATQRSR